MAPASRLLRSSPGPILGLGVALVLGSGRAYALDADAENRSVARELARDGAELADAGKCGEALDLFERAHALVGAPTIAVMQARCLVELGRLIEALEVYEGVQRRGYQPNDSDAFKHAVTDSAEEAHDIRARIPRLQISVSGPGASSTELRVWLDDKPIVRALLGVERPIDPGAHRLEASVPGQSAALQNVSLGESRRYVVELRLQPSGRTDKPRANVAAESSGSSLQRNLGWVALGVGGASLATGAVTALMASDKQSTLNSQCPNHAQCPPSVRDDLDSFRTFRTASFIGYGVGFAAVTTGAVLLLTAPKRQAPPADTSAFTPWIGIGSAGVRGRF